jgi:hypothetical protein
MSWLFAVSATLSPTKPILFIADVQSTGSSWQWTLTPLDAKTRTPLPGSTIALPDSGIPGGGGWSYDPPLLFIPGAANPITGSDIEADVQLAGTACGSDDFLCGDLTGSITKPVSLDLAGSTWTLTRLSGDVLPDPIYVSCACLPADPPAP